MIRDVPFLIQSLLWMNGLPVEYGKNDWFLQVEHGQKKPIPTIDGILHEKSRKDK